MKTHIIHSISFLCLHCRSEAFVEKEQVQMVRGYRRRSAKPESNRNFFGTAAGDSR